MLFRNIVHIFIAVPENKQSYIVVIVKFIKLKSCKALHVRCLRGHTFATIIGIKVKS